MFPSVTILDWWVDSKEMTRYTQGVEKSVITIAAWLPRPDIDWSAGHALTLCVYNA